MFNNNKCVPCQIGSAPLNNNDINSFLNLIDRNWDVLNGKRIVREFVFVSYLEAIKFVNLVADLSEFEGHHPYIHINYKTIKIILFTHKINGLHENDFLLASKIDSKYQENFNNS